MHVGGLSDFLCFWRDLLVIVVVCIFVCCPRILRIFAYSPFLRISRSGRILRILDFLCFREFFDLLGFGSVLFAGLNNSLVRQELNLRPNSPRQDSSIRPHTNQRPPTVHPTTLHSPFPRNHTLPTPPRTHLSHPPPHRHTLKDYFFSTNVPQTFLSEYIGTASAELLIRSVNSQPWRFTNNSLGLPHAPSLSVCLFL